MEKRVYKSGEVPGAGKFRCIVCGYVLEIKAGEALPACPKCGVEEYSPVFD